MPTLIVHGDDDQIVPIDAAGARLGEARQEREADGLPRRAARPHRHAQGPAQRRPAGVPEGVRLTRRELLASGAAALAAGCLPPRAPRTRPEPPYGVQSGDVSADRAVIWSRTDRPARLIVEYATTTSFTNLERVMGPAALPRATSPRASISPACRRAGHLLPRDLPGPGRSEDPERPGPRVGCGRRPAGRRTVRFASGRRGRAGLGHQPGLGRHATYEAMRRTSPTSSSTRATRSMRTGRSRPEVKLADGALLEEPHHADEGEGRARRSTSSAATSPTTCSTTTSAASAAEVPFLVQWDDHEARNNWYPGTDPRETSATGATRRLAAGRVRAARDVRVQPDAHRPR